MIGSFLKACVGMLVMFGGPRAHGSCEVKESTATSGGYRELKVGKLKVIDVDSFKEVGGKVFYATSPVYGKPEVGVIECGRGKRSQLVSPKNFDKAYPDGTDFFRLKDVTKHKGAGSYTVEYYHVPDVDSQEFGNLENERNLKSVIFPVGK